MQYDDKINVGSNGILNPAKIITECITFLLRPRAIAWHWPFGKHPLALHYQ